MSSRRIVVVGTSAGGIEALRGLVRELPHAFPAPVCIVMHTAPESSGLLHDILGRAGVLPAVQPADMERLRPGYVYVAPPDHHLIVEPGRLRVTRGPRENRFRPAVDPLFRSAAQVFGPGAIGVVLTGNLDDGTAGLWAIKQLGGIAIVQDPADAECPSMPANAQRHVAVDHVVPLRGIAALLVRLTTESLAEIEPPVAPGPVEVEVSIAKGRNPVDAGVQELGRPSSFACPECHGVLLQVEEGGRFRFRCHTGHAYSAESLRAAIDQGIEGALWKAYRSLEEGGLLMRQLATHFEGHGGGAAAEFGERSTAIAAQAEHLRVFLAGRVPLRMAG